jgi:molybdenum cofactor cytidylyltransferase
MVNYEQLPQANSNLPNVGLVLLAAGGSTRLGAPKQMLPYQGRSLLRHAAEVAVASLCQPIIVVLGANAERLQQEVDQLPVRVVENLRWAEGMSTSVGAGIEALIGVSEPIEAAVFMLCDQPFASSQIINEIVKAYTSTGKPIVASQYREALGVPALFSRPLFSELTALSGDQGAKKVIAQHIHEVFGIAFPGGAIDIDTPKDYEQLLGSGN